MFVFLIMFFTHMETSPFPAATKGRNFNLYSAFQIIEHWECHRYCGARHTFVKSSPRTSGILVCWLAFVSGTVTTYMYLNDCRDRAQNSDPSHARQKLYHRRVERKYVKKIMYNNQHNQSRPRGHTRFVILFLIWFKVPCIWIRTFSYICYIIKGKLDKVRRRC